MTDAAGGTPRVAVMGGGVMGEALLGSAHRGLDARAGGDHGAGDGARDEPAGRYAVRTGRRTRTRRHARTSC